MIPTEISVSDRRETELAEEGFIPLVWRKDSDNAVFMGAQSAQKAKTFGKSPEGKQAEANFKLGEMQGTTHSTAPLMIVNGPVVDHLDREIEVHAPGQGVAGGEKTQFLVLLADLELGFLQARDHGFQVTVTLFQLGNVIEGNQHPLQDIVLAQNRRGIDGKL